MLNLTKSDKYSDITTVGGQILLYGVASGPFPEASQTCSSAVVNPSTLKLSDLRSGSCADPALQGESVLPILSAAKTIPGGGVITYAIRIAHVSTAAPGYRLGPVVMTFPEGSTSNPDWIYGDGSLWLYDASSPGDHDLLRISESTGDVVQQLDIPSIVRPLLAFDDDGLWIAPTTNSLGVTNEVLRLTPGATDTVPVFALPDNRYASWVIATGHSVWLDEGRTLSAAGTLWNLTGPSATRGSHVALSSEMSNVLEQQHGSPGVVGDASDGLWTAIPTASGVKQQAVRLNLRNGSATNIASLKPGYATPNELLFGSWQAITDDGSMYLLDPPSNAPVYPYQPEGFSALYRITPTR
jgi:hypothetical protein